MAIAALGHVCALGRGRHELIHAPYGHQPIEDRKFVWAAGVDNVLLKEMNVLIRTRSRNAFTRTTREFSPWTPQSSYP
jgi:hypothetical protein